MSDRRRPRSTASGVTLALALLLVVFTVGAASFDTGSHGAVATAAPTPSGRSNSGDAPACPLTPTQQQKAVTAFDQMMPVLLHPRCINCHGGVDPFVDPAKGGHLGGEQDLPENPDDCQLCHDGLPGWTVTGPPMFFGGKSAKELCVQFKKFEKTGGLFVGHIDRENGGIQFIGSAFKGDRALNELGKEESAEKSGRAFMIEPPPGTREQLVAQAQDWVDAVGAGWSATPECGCEVTGTWDGTVTATYQIERRDWQLWHPHPDDDRDRQIRDRFKPHNAR
jgi:hypothetical protein